MYRTCIFDVLILMFDLVFILLKPKAQFILMWTDSGKTTLGSYMKAVITLPYGISERLLAVIIH